MRIEYTVQVWEEGGQYVAHAMPLDVMSAGDSPEEARRAVDEAVKVFVEVAQDRDSLQEVLEEAGYTLVHGEWVSPPWVGVERHAVSVAR